MNLNALTLRQNVCIYISGWILTVASASSPQIHSARQGLNSSTWKRTDDGRVKASCALWAAPSSKQSIPGLVKGERQSLRRPVSDLLFSCPPLESYEALLSLLTLVPCVLYDSQQQFFFIFV